MKKLSAILVATTVVIGMSLAAGSAFAENGAPRSDAQDPAAVTVDGSAGQGDGADAADGADATDAADVGDGADAVDAEDSADAADPADVEDGADAADAQDGADAVDGAVADAPDVADHTASPRSQEVAAVPRAAAKQASTVKGNETGKLVSAWAKTHANKKIKPANVHAKVPSSHVTGNLAPKVHGAGHATGHGKNG